MTAIVDVDSHWTFTWEFRADAGPTRVFADRLPNEAGMLTYFLADDLMRSLPAAERPNPDTLWPMKTRADGVVSRIPSHWDATSKETRVEDRLAWMDRTGIDYSIVNSGGFAAAFPLIDDIGDRKKYCQLSNDLLVEAIGDHTDRLGGVTYADLTDLDWAITELTRMRRLGSRAFSIRAEPVNGLSLGHPAFDRLWSAVTDLGMIVNVHIGLAPAIFGDWGRVGFDVLKPADAAAFMRLSNSQRYQAAELFLSAMIFGGAFERHPRLTVLIAELRAAWFPHFVARVDSLTHPAVDTVLGKWEKAQTAGEYLHRQVRLSPLPGLGDDGIDVLTALPDMIVFSSDYPHTEGNDNPIGIYEKKLATVPQHIRDAFMGTTIAEDFRKMGDPLPIEHVSA